MAVRLELQTIDSQEIELAKRYWAMDEEGVYLERVADLLPFREITQPGMVAKYIRQICTAYDENQICPICDGAIQIGGRAEAKKTLRQSYHSCKACQELQREETEKREAKERAELEEKLSPHIALLREKTISYSNLPDDAVLTLQAIYALVGPRLAQGTFALHECDELTPLGADDILDRLYKQNILVDDPTAANPGAYYLHDGKLWFKKGLARYFLPPDIGIGCSQEALNILLNREFTDSVALINLWLDYAVTDVMRYLNYQCEVHNQALEVDDIEKIEGTVRHGLHRYSVAQMWFLMWKVTRDAAALASRSYYSRVTATATIPTKIRKQLEIADRGAEPRNEWSRPEPHISGALGMVFNSAFGLDEYSRGREVLEMFDRLGGKGRSDIDIHELAAAFMEETLETQRALPALEAFAEMIRAGLSTEDALNEVCQYSPELFK